MIILIGHNGVGKICSNNQPIIKPRGMLPTSPKKSWDGDQFHHIKPNADAAKTNPERPISDRPPLIRIIRNNPLPILIVSTAVIPSIPSIKLKTLINHTQINAIIMSSNQVGKR